MMWGGSINAVSALLKKGEVKYEKNTSYIITSNCFKH
jgi:hypothetical protein